MTVTEIEDRAGGGLARRGSDRPGGRGVEALNRTDVAIVQHEYGIYGGPDGDDVLDVARRARRAVDRRRAHRAARARRRTSGRARAVVRRGRRRRRDDRDAPDAGWSPASTSTPTKVIVIPHGAATPATDAAAPTRSAAATAALLTWGLLGPGKGIEWAIDALALLADLRPRPEYLDRRRDPSEGARHATARPTATCWCDRAAATRRRGRRSVRRPLPRRAGADAS